MKSRLLCALTVVGVTFGSIGAFAATTQVAVRALQADIEAVSGKIKAVDMEKKSFTLIAGEKEFEITFSDETIYTLDGKEASRDEVLKEGQAVVVTHEARLATRVDATSKL